MPHDVLDIAAPPQGLFGPLPETPATRSRPTPEPGGVQLPREPRRGRPARPELPGQLYFDFYLQWVNAMADESRPQPSPDQPKPKPPAEHPPADAAQPEPPAPDTAETQPPTQLPPPDLAQPQAARPEPPRPEPAGASQAPKTTRPGSLVEASAGTFDTIHQVRRAQWRSIMLAGAAGLLVMILTIARLSAPLEVSRRGWAILAAILAAGLFTAGLVVLQLRVPKPNSLDSLAQTVKAYLPPTQLAVGLNSLGLVSSAVCLLAGGLGASLWLVYLGLVGLSVMGIVLAWPRIGTVRQLHPSPQLPYAR